MLFPSFSRSFIIVLEGISGLNSSLCLFLPIKQSICPNKGSPALEPSPIWPLIYPYCLLKRFLLFSTRTHQGNKNGMCEVLDTQWCYQCHRFIGQIHGSAIGIIGIGNASLGFSYTLPSSKTRQKADGDDAVLSRQLASLSYYPP